MLLKREWLKPNLVKNVSTIFDNFRMSRRDFMLKSSSYAVLGLTVPN